VLLELVWISRREERPAFVRSRRSFDAQRQVATPHRRCLPNLSVVKAVLFGVTVLTVLLASSAVAWAGAWGGDSGDTVSVGVSSSSTSYSQPGGSSYHGASRPASASASVKSPAIICQLVAVSSSSSQALGAGGPTPGQWYLSSCSDSPIHGPRGGLVWVPNSTAPASVGVDPLSLAQQAADSITLPGPAIHANPSAYSVVNVPTWLWIDPSTWRPFVASATAGGVTATAVATPSYVTWSMGDGGTVVCEGSGVAYDTTQPASEQHTDCSYTYRQSSIGQPSPDGNPNDGAYPVTATITWAVTWTVTGATGEGALPNLRTSSTIFVRVEQIESIVTG